MNDLSKIKYKVNDLEMDLNRIISIMPKSRCIDKSTSLSGEIDIFTGVSVLTSELAYEITIMGGVDIVATLKINDEIVVCGSKALMSGVIIVAARKKNSLELNVTGSGINMARLKLTGAGLRLI